LIWYFLSILIFELFFGIENELECISEGLLVVIDIEMRVAEVGGFHEEIAEIESFVVGLKVEHSKANKRHLITIIEEDFGVGVHVWVVILSMKGMDLVELSLNLKGISYKIQKNLLKTMNL
jgi:hypothetical protein